MWYPHAESNQLPQAGIVTEVKQEGVYVMYIFPKGGGIPIQKSNVHHVEDDFLADNPNMRVLYGGWDTVESAERRRADAADSHRRRVQASAEEAKAGNRKEQESARVSILSERGFSSEEIVKKLGGDWTEKSVEAVIDNHKDTQVA